MGIEKESTKQVQEKVQHLKQSIQLNRERIVKAYNIHPDLGYLASILSKNGMDSINNVKITPGIPLRAMLGERLPSISHILDKMEGKTALEYKYDGLRIQAHVKNGGEEINLFSRQLEKITDQFPDVVEHIKAFFKGSNCIIEGECVPIEIQNGSMLPFQVISQRRGRKYDLKEKIDEIPVNFVIFDCLFLNDVEMIDSPYLERRRSIDSIFPDIKDGIDAQNGLSLSRMKVVEDVQKGEDFFQEALNDGCEGIMAKSIGQNSIYQAGNRGWLWIKYKRDYMSEMVDTLDLVVVGAYHGAGRRGGTYGALLMAAYDADRDMFQTVCKLGSGFNDQHLEVLPGMLSDLRTGGDPHPKLDTKMEADIYFKPFMVLEVKGAEITFSPTHTCAWGSLKENSGLAVRFPRFTGRFREDKGPRDATSVEEILKMYKHQIKTI
jgi:DNA ligase-1